MRQFNKIFGVGLPRCAGQTLHVALYRLLQIDRPGSNFKCSHSMERPHWHDPDRIDAMLSITETYLPYDYLDWRFPGSLYIYNDRDLAPWLTSCQKVYDRSIKLYEDGYFRYWNHPLWLNPIDAFEDFYYEWREMWMGQRPREDFLLWNIPEDPNWETLCDFLECPVPNDPFPNVDKTRGMTTHEQWNQQREAAQYAGM